MARKKLTNAELSEKRRQAGKKGGAACLKKYGRDYFSALGKKGGRSKLPTLEQLKAQASKRGQIQIEGGNELPNGLTALKKLWKEIQNRI